MLLEGPSCRPQVTFTGFWAQRGPRPRALEAQRGADQEHLEGSLDEVELKSGLKGHVRELGSGAEQLGVLSWGV